MIYISEEKRAKDWLGYSLVINEYLAFRLLHDAVS